MPATTQRSKENSGHKMLKPLWGFHDTLPPRLGQRQQAAVDPHHCCSIILLPDSPSFPQAECASELSTLALSVLMIKHFPQVCCYGRNIGFSYPGARYEDTKALCDNLLHLLGVRKSILNLKS